MSTRSHEEYHENIGAYVLGALPELESEVLERHLSGCEVCRAEVDRLSPVTDALARSVPQVEAPPSLKENLMRTVREEAAEPARKPARRWFAVPRPRLAVAMALSVGVLIGVAAVQISADGPDRTLSAATYGLPAGAASLELSNDGADATIKLDDAPEPPAGKGYQLWIRDGDTIKRGPVFTDSEEKIPGGVKGADQVMVTVERQSGVAAPTGDPVISFNI